MIPMTDGSMRLSVPRASGWRLGASDPAGRGAAPESPTGQDRMLAGLSALIVWALVVASIVFWGNRLLVTDAARPASAPVPADRPPDRAAFARLLGESTLATLPPVQARATDARFQLSGVVASIRPGGLGIALIAVDGKMARAYRTGATVEGDVVLQAVSRRSATLASMNGTSTIVLELPLPTAAWTGVLQVGAAMPAAGVLQPAAAMPAQGVWQPAAAMPAEDTGALPGAPFAASALATAPGAAGETPPAPAVDLVQAMPPRGPGSPNGLSPGRRQRLRGLGNVSAHAH